MALAFGNTNGSAKKSNIEYYKMSNGDNVFRMVGGILPRYTYWIKTRDGKDVSIECLGFNREEERFDNLIKDHVKDFFPDLNCAWSYNIQVLDPADPGKIKVLGLKKKMFAQIMDAAQSLGDPTDLQTGYDIHVKRVKTGPLPYNIEYTVQVLKLKPSALSAEDLAVIEAAPTIDEQFPRQTAEEQLKFLTDRVGPAVGNVPEEMDEFNTVVTDDDIPF